MKTSKDPRHINRIKAMQELFAWDFTTRKGAMGNISNQLASEVIKNLSKIDNEIKKSAPSWPIGQINKIDLAILRLAIYELLFKNGESSTAPYKVIVDEAVELAKEYGSEGSFGFINGVLGDVIESHHLQD